MLDDGRLFGHHGRLLKVDLSSGEVRAEPFDTAFARAFLGGNGFAAKVIHDTVPAGTDPFGEANTLVFAVGPLTDTPVWGSGRGQVAAVSPLTGQFADSNFGGHFGSELKRTGFDAVCVTGVSADPVYLAVTEDGACLKDAGDMRGKTTDATIAMIEEAEGGGAAAVIGPAGEKRVLFASIVCSGARMSVAGRCGLGAVMGAKGLKAIAVRGNRPTLVAEPEKLKAFLDERVAGMKAKAALLTTHGTPFLVEKINARGLLGTHNAREQTFAFADDIGAGVLKEKYVTRKVACRRCPVACGKMVKVPHGPFAGRTIKMAEYESIFAVGPMLDNRDIVSILNANGLCDAYGLDTVSMGVTLAFVAECLERGFVTPADLGGEVRFADGEGMVDLVRATALREGIGDLLALGSRRLAGRFGSGAHRCLYEVKGLEISGHSATGLRSLALGYATATRGGSHHDGRPRYPETDGDPGFGAEPEFSVRTQNFTAVGDSLVMCRFLHERAFGFVIDENTATALNLVTGWDVGADELERIGERIYNLERLVSVGQGADRGHDTLPYRAMHEPIPDGPARGRHCPPEQLEKMLDAYYRMRGWSPRGIPTPRKLKELGLGGDA